MRHLLLSLCVSLAAQADDFADTPEFSHAMDIQTKLIDGFPVVFHYGDIRPDFEETTRKGVHKPDYEPANPSKTQARPHRKYQALTGSQQAWKFRFDPDKVGLTEGWARTSDFSDWQSISVPHCWDTMLKGNFWDWSKRNVNNPPFYNGAAWYACSFDTQLESKHNRIEFLGIPHRVRIFLNGTLLALHEGGGQPFSIDVTKHLRGIGEGSNTLAVQIIRLPNFRKKKQGKGFDEIEYVHTRHPKAPDNWPYAGIPREITLIGEDWVTIRKVQIRSTGGRLEAALCLSNHDSKPHEGIAAIQSDSFADPNSPQKPYRIEAGGHTLIRLTAPLKPDAARWSPDSPRLHKVTAIIDTDTLENRFGIRDFKIEGTSFQLDGKATFLKGAAFYEEHPDTGNALTPEQHLNLMTKAKSSGSNFVRLHVAERHPLIYQLADRMGLMLCAEWGGFWYKAKSMGAQTEDPRSIYQSLGRCALWDLQNHPSVVIWGVHNECHQFCPEYEPFVKMAHDLVDQHDWQQRPVTWAAWHPTKGEPHFEHADAVGFNEYRGAMDPFEELDPDLKEVTTKNPGKPLIIMENGGWSTLGKRGSAGRKGTEDWQADLLRRQHEVLIEHAPPLAGYTYWLLVDYRSRKTYTGNKSQDGWSRMGMINEWGKPKLVHDVFRSLDWPVAK